MTHAQAGLFKHAVPLVSRGGLLVVRLEAHGYLDHQSTLQLAVCNLLAGTCDMLPPLKCSEAFNHWDLNGYAIVTSAGCRSKDEPSLPMMPSNSLCFFKVVIIGSVDLKYNLYVFSSDKSSWIMHNNCFHIITSQLYHYGIFTDAIVCSGMIHWVFRYPGESCVYVINLDVRT